MRVLYKGESSKNKTVLNGLSLPYSFYSLLSPPFVSLVGKDEGVEGDAVLTWEEMTNN